MADLSDLQRFRQSAQSVVEAIPPPHPADTRRITLAFDQSVANTAWVLMVGVGVRTSGIIKTAAVAKGHTDTMMRGEIIFRQVCALIGLLQPGMVVYEEPPISIPGRVMRPESSLIAAFAIRLGAAHHEVGLMPVSAQKAKKRWTGNGNAKKAEVRSALLTLDPSIRSLKPWNEHVVDAISVGWLSAEKEVADE